MATCMDDSWLKPAPPFYMCNDEDATLNDVINSIHFRKTREQYSKIVPCVVCGENINKIGGYVSKVATCWDCMRSN